MSPIFGMPALGSNSEMGVAVTSITGATCNGGWAFTVQGTGGAILPPSTSGFLALEYSNDNVNWFSFFSKVCTIAQLVAGTIKSSYVVVGGVKYIRAYFNITGYPDSNRLQAVGTYSYGAIAVAFTNPLAAAQVGGIQTDIYVRGSFSGVLDTTISDRSYTWGGTNHLAFNTVPIGNLTGAPTDLTYSDVFGVPFIIGVSIQSQLTNLQVGHISDPLTILASQLGNPASDTNPTLFNVTPY